MSNTGKPDRPFIVQHSHTYAGNCRSVEHFSATLERGLSESDLCEIDVRMHISFTPGHPVAMLITQASNALTEAMALQKHLELDHADGSDCPYALRGEQCTKGE